MSRSTELLLTLFSCPGFRDHLLVQSICPVVTSDRGGQTFATNGVGPGFLVFVASFPGLVLVYRLLFLRATIRYLTKTI